MKENTNTFRKKAAELYKQNKLKEIIVLLTDEVLERENDSELYAWMARANYRLDNAAVTMLFAEKAIATDPTCFIGFYSRALAWADRKEYEKAIKDYTKAIELNLDFADAYYKRGVAWQNLNENIKANADFDKAIESYCKTIKINPKDAELYLWRGNTWYSKTKYQKAIKDYTKAIENDPDFKEAYYNRGLARFAKKEYNKAIDDYTKIINVKPKYADVYYYDRGNAYKAIKEYEKAIDDYTEAIKKNPTFENAFYNRGLAKKENNIDLEGSKQDFKKYLKLSVDENDIGVRYAKYYLKKLDEINDIKLTDIAVLVSKIKEILRINEDSITHYTSLSVIKSLILDCNKFRISEGNFMNDPSEGMEFFNFLDYNPSILNKDDSSAEPFSPKPFIGSFVTKVMNNDLNMWRFYGKEDGVEAKGCAIVLRTHEFIEDIKNSLSNEKNKEARIDDESDISFYQVVYLPHKSTDFNIPNLKRKKNKEFNGMMDQLKGKVTSYKEAKDANITSLEEYLNNIAFLFKRDEYKNENEVRLVMKGIEFQKKFCKENKEDKSVNPPRVYIELEPIKKRVGQITLGPKVDKANEWASALHYSYKEEEKTPEIKISHLPYK
jgi:tetratricopeptide (TPR) repeat protein